jgi:hypothetical protein
MATEPIKISGMTQAQRNAIIAALGCKTVHRMNNGDSLPVDFEPDELIIDTGITTNLTYTVPIVIDIPEKYIPIYADGEVQTKGATCWLRISDKDGLDLLIIQLNTDNIFSILPCYGTDYSFGSLNNFGKFNYYVDNDNNEDFSFRLIITFRKLSLTF